MRLARVLASADREMRQQVKGTTTPVVCADAGCATDRLHGCDEGASSAGHLSSARFSLFCCCGVQQTHQTAEAATCRQQAQLGSHTRAIRPKVASTDQDWSDLSETLRRCRVLEHACGQGYPRHSVLDPVAPGPLTTPAKRLRKEVLGGGSGYGQGAGGL